MDILNSELSVSALNQREEKSAYDIHTSHARRKLLMNHQLNNNSPSFMINPYDFQMLCTKEKIFSTRYNQRTWSSRIYTKMTWTFTTPLMLLIITIEPFQKSQRDRTAQTHGLNSILTKSTASARWLSIKRIELLNISGLAQIEAVLSPIVLEETAIVLS